MKGNKNLIWTILLCIAFSLTIKAQTNLIPNHSFEEFSGAPIGWFYKGSQFTRLVKYWYSPSLASPDVFGPDIVVPSHWKKKGFGEQKPYDGKSMVGITVYGCSEGKPHCREYLQLQTNESLVIGQKYEIVYWLAHLEHSLYIDKLGILMTEEPLKQSDDELITGEPQFKSTHVIKPFPQQWQKIEGSFIADKTYNYLTFGNFYTDEENKVEQKDNLYKFAYYYIDHIELKKVPPYIIQKVPADDLSRQSLEVGKKIKLKNIYFDLDKSDLLPRSFIELNKLRKIMEDNPKMTIEVHGHTDIQGESDYNEKLSMQRAHSVSNYLIKSGVTESRIDFKGFGSNMPIANNADEGGRQLNRRVEILITAL